MILYLHQCLCISLNHCNLQTNNTEVYNNKSVAEQNIRLKKELVVTFKMRVLPIRSVDPILRPACV